MKIIQKLFLLTVLGIGVFVHGADSIQSKIRDKVTQHQPEIAHIKNSNQLNQFLASLRSELLTILNSENCLSDRNQKLKSALEKLNPADKFSIASNIKDILHNLDHDIATIIKNAIPQVYRSILGL